MSKEIELLAEYMDIQDTELMKRINEDLEEISFESKNACTIVLLHNVAMLYAGKYMKERQRILAIVKSEERKNLESISGTYARRQLGLFANAIMRRINETP